jgi:hypothetical protein
MRVNLVFKEESSGATFAVIVSLFSCSIFPCLFTLRFANKMRIAIDANDMHHLNESFRNLKITFRYLVIVTIIFLALVIIGLLSEI